MRKYIIITISIGIVGLFFFINKNINNSQDTRIQLINNHITLLPNDNSYIIEITWTGQQEDMRVILHQTLTSISDNKEPLRKSNILFVYNSRDNILENLTIESLSWSDTLDHAYLVFIDDILSSKLGSNLLWSGWVLGDKKQTANLFAHKYERTITRLDTTWSRQNMMFSYSITCSILQYFSITKHCSVDGDFSVSTPLSSGPILWKIQGQFSTSVLQ